MSQSASSNRIPNHDILILYGSETGTAKGIAEDIEQLLIYRQFKPFLSSLDEYPITRLPEETYVMFVVSTTGQGECPGNMKQFWQFLLIKDLPSDALSEMKFGLFGLGDSSYKLFNAVGRKLFQRLLQLGATSLCDRGLGDDQHPLGIDGAFDVWIQSLLESLKKHFPMKNFDDAELKAAQLPEAKWQVEFIESPEEETIQVIEHNWKQLPTPLGCTQNSCVNAQLTCNNILTSAGESKITRHIELKSDNIVNYIPGDIVCILPKNSPAVCESVAKHIGVSLDQIIKITCISDGNKKLPKIMSIKELLSQWLAISQPPSKQMFNIMSHFTDDELHKEKCIELSSKEGRNEYYEFAVRERRNLAEILDDFHTVKLPIEYLIHATPLQQHRLYSISSDSQHHLNPKSTSNSLSLTLAVVNYKTKFQRQITGLCSEFLSNSIIGDNVAVWVKKGTMCFPLGDAVQTPVIMVGPGTGVAPFISFIQHRESEIIQKELAEEDYKDKTVLFFGCRHSKKDYLYGDYLTKMDQENKIKLYSAFSREFEDKVYVQHLIVKETKTIATMIFENIEKIRIFVCGTAKYMPDSVQDAFVKIISEQYFNGDKDKGQEFIEKLIKKRQYIVEAW